MRKWLLLFGILITNCMFAEINIKQIENSNYETIQTRYIEISPGDLDLSSEGLYAFFNGDWMEVVSLHRTLRGYEVEIKALDHLEERGPVMDWKCPHCGYINTMFQKKCGNCGRRP